MNQEIIISSFRDAEVRETVIGLFRLEKFKRVADRDPDKGSVDLIAHAKMSLRHEMAHEVNKNLKIETQRSIPGMFTEIRGVLNLPYIYDQAMKAKDADNEYMSRYYRGEIRKLEKVIFEQQRYIETPWYSKFADWWSRP